MNAKLAYAGFCALLLGQSLWAAPALKDVRWTCASSSCQLVFPFAAGAPLPSYYQKFDASKQTLRVAFSISDFALADGTYDVDAQSPWVRSVKVSRDLARSPQLVYLDFSCGNAIHTDKNTVALRNKADFTVEFPLGTFASAKSWKLSKLRAQKQAAPLSVSKPIAGPIAAPAPAPAPAVVSKTKEKTIAPKGVSAELLPSIQEISVLNGSGLEQLMLRTDRTLEPSMMNVTDTTVELSLQGPATSAVFKIGAGSIAQSVYWSNGKLVVSLQRRSSPIAMIQGGKLILQRSSKSVGSLETWSARSSGITRNSWRISAEAEDPDNLDAFAASRQKSNSLSTNSGTIQVRRIDASYIAVEDAVALFASPSEQSNILVTLNFGDRMQKLELTGLFYKVKAGELTGYVNRRQVATDAEMSVAQKERLQRMQSEKPGSDSVALRFETTGDDRISYSSFGRRDPFIEVKGLADEGINIDQVELAGIIWESEVPMALLADTKVAGVSYTVKEGDKILNGKVLKITKTDVLFLIQEFGVSRRYSMTLPDKYGGKK